MIICSLSQSTPAAAAKVNQVLNRLDLSNHPPLPARRISGLFRSERLALQGEEREGRSYQLGFEGSRPAPTPLLPGEYNWLQVWFIKPVCGGLLAIAMLFLRGCPLGLFGMLPGPEMGNQANIWY